MDLQKYLGGDISVYVGTYKKYNEGSIKGAWVNMEAVKDVEQFYRICHQIHKERDPEFMFQDYQGFPEWLYSESMGSKEIAEILHYAHATPEERAKIACDDVEDEQPLSLVETLRLVLSANNGSNVVPGKNGDKTLLEEYMQEWEKVWPSDKRMLDYERKQWSGGVRLENGGIVYFEKPSIKTSFCFGYSSCGQGPEYDEANKACQAASSEEYFLQKNLGGMDEVIRALECNCRFPENERSWDYDGKTWYLERKCYSGELLNLWEYHAWRDWEADDYTPGTYEKMSEADRKAILAGLKRERDKFEKRLRTYLKRYGTSKLRTWTYWMDE